MSANNHFILHAVECMAGVVPISYRRIFNGYGIYHHGVQFAIVVHDQLFFRADDFSRGLYLAKKMSAFQPGGLIAVESSFFQLPNEVLNNPPELIYWMRIAVEAAQSAYAMDDIDIVTKPPVRHLHTR